MRRAAKVDGNHSDIVTALRRCGCRVLSLATIGKGVPDLLVFKRSTGLLRLLEVKAKKGRLTVAQLESFPQWPVWVVRSVPEALEAMEIEAA